MLNDPTDDRDDDALAAALATHYRIAREIGQGGMAIVYLADDIRHNRPVAIKVLRPEIAGVINRQRFLQEMQFASRLTHPNIVPLFDSGEAAGRLYYVMPFVDGQSLQDLLARRGVLPVREAIRLVCDVADALAYAHAHQILHRDIKPANILTVAGRALVSDFGIAKAMRNATTAAGLTSTQLVIGTPAYMSPEQGRPGSVVDGRSDVFSLSVVLYEALAGQLPPVISGVRNGESIATLRRRAAADAVPRHVEQTLHKGLAIDPVNRVPSAEALADGLRGSGMSLRPRAAVAVALGTALLSLAYVLAHRLPPPPLLSSRVLVVPFVNYTADSQFANTGTMAADWITQGLQQAGVSNVVPTSMALQSSRFVEQQRKVNPSLNPLKLLASETGARIVIEGSLYRDGKDLQIQIQVVDAPTGNVIGAVAPIRKPIDQSIDGVKEARSRVMTLLAMKLDERVAASADLPDQPPTFEAYNEFVLGLESYVRTEYADAAAHFSSAVAADSTFDSALLMQSINVSNLGDYARADSILGRLASHSQRLSPYEKRWLEYRHSLMNGDRLAALRAIRAVALTTTGTKATYNLAGEALQNGYLREAERAILSLAPDRGPMRGWVQYWETVSRVRHLLREITAELSDGARARVMYPDRQSVLLVLIRPLAALGRQHELSTLLDSAERMPRDVLGIGPAELALEAALELHAHGFARQSVEMANRGKQWLSSPPGAGASTVNQRWTLARLEYELGHWAEARDLASRLANTSPGNGNFLGLEGASALRAGDTITARRVDERLASIPRRYDLGIATFAQARVAAIRGQRDVAIALLRDSFAEGHEFDLWIDRDLDFASLRGTPSYDDLVRAKDK